MDKGKFAKEMAKALEMKKGIFGILYMKIMEIRIKEGERSHVVLAPLHTSAFGGPNTISAMCLC